MLRALFLILPAALLVADDSLPNTETDLSLPLMPAAEAAQRMQLPQGFTCTVFASEPQVQNPVAMAWDKTGRLWVAENYTYAERALRFDLKLKDRVIILADKDADGVAEERRVFTDSVQMLTSVELGRGGVWLLCPPQLLFVPDANGDDVPDGPPQCVLDGFTVAKDNYHNLANGLRWGPDGWLYGRCGHSCPGLLGVPGTPEAERLPLDGGLWRFHPERKVVEVLCHGTTNPWGHDWDEQGELFFINTVNGHLWHMLPGSHFKESFGLSQNPLVYERMDTIADHYHYDTTGSWQDSRDGKANSLGGGHAHVGMMMYQGTAWPEQYRGRLFTLNMHGRRANVERMERQGAGYVGRHEPDVLLSADPWFRGIEISQGPDGQGYLLDWSDTGECHESTGVHRQSGRIYRVSYGKPSTAQPVVQPWCMAGAGPLPQLWRDYQAGKTSPAALRALLLKEGPEHEHLRVWAIRLLTDSWPLDTLMGQRPVGRAETADKETLAALTALATRDAAGLVQLQLASSLQRIPVAQREVLAAAIASHTSYAEDKQLPLLLWYGLAPCGADPAARVAARSQWPLLHRYAARRVFAEERSEAAQDALLATSLKSAPALKQAVLQGMAEALVGQLKARKPKDWAAFAQSLPAQSGAMVKSLSALFGDGRALQELEQAVRDPKAEVQDRAKALTTLIRSRPENLRELCESLLDTRILNTTAVRGLAVFDDPAIGQKLASTYRKFYPAERPTVVEVLVSRPSWAAALLDAVGPAKHQIPRADISAYQARQISAHGEPELSEKLRRVWGELGTTTEAKLQLLEQWKERLTPATLAAADLKKGRALYGVCAACHQLYGEGGKIGPDLTGSGRANLNYLLENILDPSGVVSADYRVTTVQMKDGRVLSGVVLSETDSTLTLRQITEETSLPKADVQQTQTSPLSLMPEGLLTAFTPEQVRDLIAYLMHPSQVR